MKKPPASLYTLVIGIGLGFLITQSTNQTSPERDGNAPAPEGRSSPAPRRASSSRTASAGKARAGAPTSVSGSLAGLLHLTSINYGAPDSIAFMTAVEALGGDDIASILIDLEDLEKGDPRQYRIRNALFNRWAQVDPEGAWDAARQHKDKSVRSQMISNVIGAITRADPGKARQLLADIKDPQSKQQALHAFVTNAATEDPEGAFQVLTSEMKSSQSNYQYQTLFHLWAKEDPEGALAKLNEVKGAQNRQMALNGIATALATSDPDRAVAFANQIANTNDRNNTLNSVVGTLASTNPQRALEILDGMPPGQGRSNMLSSIASTWMRSDPDAAIEWIKALPPAEKTAALQQGFWQLSQQDPAKAAELISSIPVGNQTSHYFSNLASQWAQQDPAAAARWVETLPAGRSREQAMSGIINIIAQNDPAKAASILGSEGVAQHNASQVGTIVGEWAKTDQHAALAWLESLDLKGDIQRYAVSEAVSNWASVDAPAAGRYAMGIENEKVRQQAIDSLMRGWGQSDPDAAHQWLTTTLDGESKSRSLNTLIQSLSYQDFTTALRYYKEATANLTPEAIDKTFGDATSQLANGWAQHDPKAAGEWLTSLPEGDKRSNSIQNIVDNWGDYDIKGAAEFVNTLAEGKERDQAVERLVHDVQRSDPESAFAWAASVSDASRRENMIRNAANQWKDHDPAAARKAVAGADISENARASILKSLEN